MKSGLKIIVFLAMLFPYTASAKQIKNYEYLKVRTLILLECVFSTLNDTQHVV